jgi:hypothetical protein
VGRSYARMPIEAFGRFLLESGDLDPVYVALRRWDQKLAVTYRWLLAYWCWYDCGVASWIAEAQEPEDFWRRMGKAAANDQPTPLGGRFPRGHERRHARGKQGIEMVSRLRAQYPNPEHFVGHLCTVPPGTLCSEIAKHVRSHYLFGDWIAFKVADMAERVLSVPVSFSEGDVLMFEQPRQAALLYWKQRYLKCDANQLEALSLDQVSPRDPAGAIAQVVEHLIKEFGKFDAPPDGRRKVGLQEVETILCKWKSHVGGHYPLLNDVIEIRAGVEPWTEHSEIARSFLGAMPKPLKF